MKKSAKPKVVIKKVSKVIKSSKVKSAQKIADKTIITAALPYANGDIHIGHLLEYIQADIYSRFLKLQGKDALYICASDMHGTPIEVNARKAGEEPEKFVKRFWKEHQKDFADFLIKFDNYYYTHSPENKEFAEFFFTELKKKKLIYLKKIQIIYCNNCQRSLPDRYVKGTCPNCSTADQYGDVCESCNSALKGTDLINPKCSLCGKTPIQKESEHYFFKLSQLSDKLKNWINSPAAEIQPEVKNWLQGWLQKGLEDWCISRDGPYFGFEITDSEKETGEKKFFYVWMDAPIGYISSTKNYCDKNKLDWKDYWYQGKVTHFIGKDICYFHFLFWPAMLMELGFPLPKLNVHGFITVNGEKMSKSRGTFFTAKDFLKYYPPEALRFFYASHLDKKLVDVDLDFANFQAVTNNVFVGNLGNFCYRVLTFAEKNYGSVKDIALGAEEQKLILQINLLIAEVEKNYQQLNFKEAVKNILKIADLGNAYFQNSAVWKDKESKESKAKVGFGVNLARNLAILTSPILPEFSQKIYSALDENSGKIKWDNINFKWKGKLKPIEKLVDKIEKIFVVEKFPLQLLVGQIKEVKNHPHADSLYLLKVDFGVNGVKKGIKQVVAGLRKHFSAQDLLNQKAVFCANLKPAKIRGELSEAMVLVADDHENVSLLSVSKSELGEEAKFAGMENQSSEITFEEFKKLVLLVKGNNIHFEGKKLGTRIEDVLVRGVKEGAGVY
ncbi:MAG TPA: methionine--tRNA ligase [Candidatus Nanoarchaeia archaeon]|nr:methionine--tRNA ligase [Candidatus Nanoarchaeia archaeon]